MIRLATMADIPAIIEIGMRLVKRSSYAHTNISYSAMVERMIRAVQSPSEWLGVVEHDGVIVGALILVMVKYWWTANEYYVLDDGFYVERAGVGRKLVAAGLKWAASRGAKESMIALTSNIGDDRTARVLTRCGLHDRGMVLSRQFGEAA